VQPSLTMKEGFLMSDGWRELACHQSFLTHNSDSQGQASRVWGWLSQ